MPGTGYIKMNKNMDTLLTEVIFNSSISSYSFSVSNRRSKKKKFPLIINKLLIESWDNMKKSIKIKSNPSIILTLITTWKYIVSPCSLSYCISMRYYIYSFASYTSLRRVPYFINYFWRMILLYGYLMTIYPFHYC